LYELVTHGECIHSISEASLRLPSALRAGVSECDIVEDIAKHVGAGKKLGKKLQFIAAGSVFLKSDKNDHYLCT